MILTALVFFIVLSILVFVHEFGHYIVARFIGVKVEEFGFGLPPRIWGKKIGPTEYSLNWLPIGGFVRLAGEDQEPDSIPKAKFKGKLKEYFWARSKKERASILLAGVTMNFLLAVLITVGLLIDGVKEPSGRVHIERVIAGSPADKAGLLSGDILVSASDVPLGDAGEQKRLTVPGDVIDFVSTRKGREMQFSALRAGREFRVTMVPRSEYPKGEGPTGVAITDLELKKYPLSEAPVAATRINLERAWEMLRSLAVTVYRLVTLQPIAADVAGPVGIAQITGEAVKFGWRAVVELMSILSLNLAVLNILPVPALDGGRLAFVFLEKVMGRRIKPMFEKSTHQIGMIILLLLVLLVTINDVLRLLRG